MKAKCFDFIRECKEEKGWSWDRIAMEINLKNGTDISGEQLRDFVRGETIPFGGFLVIALEDIFGIPKRLPKSYISFKGGGGHDD